MKIFYLSAMTVPSAVSHTLSIMRMCQAFTDNGHDVLLSAVSSQPETDMIAFYGQRGGFRVQTTRLGRLVHNKITKKLMLSGLALGWKTRQMIKDFKPDLVYSRLTIAEMFFVPSNIPIIFETHSLGPLGESWWRNIAFRIATRRRNFRRIIVTTHTIADMIREKLPGAEIVVAPLSAEKPAQPNQEILEKIRNAIPGGNDFKIGYTGFIDVNGYRGMDLLVSLAARMPDIDFHIVGGPDDAASYWQGEAKGDNIFFHGYQRPDTIPAWLQCFDIVVSPLQHAPVKRAPTGKGLSLLKIPQYMSYGKTIIASDLPAHREVLLNQTDALLVEHNDIDRWVEAIRLLQSNERLRNDLGECALRKYKAEFTPERRVEKILKGFDNAGKPDQA